MGNGPTPLVSLEWPLLETLKLIVTGVGVVVPVKVVSPTTLTDDSDATAAVIDADCAELGVGPRDPPSPAETELLPGLLTTVVKPDAVSVFGMKFPLDALCACDPKLALVVPISELEPGKPAPIESLPVGPTLVEALLVKTVPLEPVALCTVPVDPALVGSL